MYPPEADCSGCNRLYICMSARSIYSRVDQSDELSSIRTSASYRELRQAQNHDVNVLGVYWSLHSFKFFCHFVNSKQDFPRMLAPFNFHGVEVDDKASPLLEDTGTVVLQKRQTTAIEVHCSTRSGSAGGGTNLYNSPS